jgi:pimeloyl-ACP methyl ester carboxylesterase
MKLKSALALCCYLILIAVSGGQQPATVQKPTVPDVAQNPPPPLGKLVDVGGYRVHLYCTGAGSPTVVIVGAGFSFNWGLVQPEVAKFTRVCSYDRSGIAWSDNGPKDSCSLRVREVHAALNNAGIDGPYVLVGHSLGALVARLYEAQYPRDVAGMVFADHAMSFTVTMRMPPEDNTSARPDFSGGGIDSDPNFSKLSTRDRELYRWAMSQPRIQVAMQAISKVAPECDAQADAILQKDSRPLGDKPLVDVSTDMDRIPEYVKLQATLLSLSRNSKEMIAERSSHFVIIDRPDVVINAIGQVVQSVHNNSKL